MSEPAPVHATCPSQKSRRGTPGGRPKKFNEASRPITLTLPERMLQLLAMVDSDRARAIEKVTRKAMSDRSPKAKRVELVEVKRGQAVIVVAHSESLKKIPWLQLVEIAPARNLLVIPSGTPIETLEVAIRDQIENLPPGDATERDLLQELRDQMSRLRREQRISKAEILFFDTRPSTRSPSSVETGKNNR